MNFKLGISDEYNRGCTDIKQVLANIRNEQTISSLSQVEIKELTKRGGLGPDGEPIDQDDVKISDPKGIGFDTMHLVSTKRHIGTA